MNTNNIKEVSAYKVNNTFFDTREEALKHLKKLKIQDVKNCIYYDEQTDDEIIDIEDMRTLFKKYGDELKDIFLKEL